MENQFQYTIPSNQHKLQKMTRLLINEQQKSLNRIKLFNRTTFKMINTKKKQLEETKKVLQKQHTTKNYLRVPQFPIQPITNHHVKIRNLKSECSIRTQKTLKSICSSRAKEKNSLAQSRRLSKKQNEQYIASSKQKELRRNLKSAKLIRQCRQNVKSAKQKYFNWKIEGVKELNKKKWDKNYNQYIQRFKRLENLRRLEFQALIQWKKNKELLLSKNAFHQQSHKETQQCFAN